MGAGAHVVFFSVYEAAPAPSSNYSPQSCLHVSDDTDKTSQPQLRHEPEVMCKYVETWPAKVWGPTGVSKVWFLSIVAKELALFLDKRSWQEATKWRGEHWFKRQYFKLHPGVRGRALTLMTLILLGNSCWLVSRRFISRPRAPKEWPCPSNSALLSGLHVWLNWHQWKVSINLSIKSKSLRSFILWKIKDKMLTDMFPSRGSPATHSHAHIEGKFRYSVNLTRMFLVCGRKLERAEETQAGMESTRTTEEKFPTAATK